MGRYTRLLKGSSCILRPPHYIETKLVTNHYLGAPQLKFYHSIFTLTPTPNPRPPEPLIALLLKHLLGPKLILFKHKQYLKPQSFPNNQAVRTIPSNEGSHQLYTITLANFMI